MAQVLKTHIKEAIVSAAIELMNEKGIDNMDMRTIAKNAGVTVGNLYRYFKDKQALIDEIIGPIFEKVEIVLLQNTRGIFSLKKYENLDLTDEKIKSEEFVQIIVDVTNECHTIVKQYPTLSPILLKDSYIKTMLGKWIESLWVSDSIEDKKQRILIKAHVNSIISGIIIILLEGIDLEKDEFREISEFYVKNTHKMMLDIIAETNMNKVVDRIEEEYV